MVCGALCWRPHFFIHGPRNTGKTTLIRTLTNIMKPLVLCYDGGTTDAGIRQTVKADSLPVVLDEFESDHDQRKLAQIIKTARSASSADTMLARGTPEGKALTFSLNIAFLFAAINPITLSPADESRIIQVDLCKHDSDPETSKRIKEGEVQFRDIGPEFCGMMVSRVKLLQPAIDMMEAAIPPCESRHRRNMATLLAGAHVALFGTVPGDEEAQQWADKHLSVIERHGEAHEADDALECLKHLMGHLVEGKMLGTYIEQAIRARNESPMQGHNNPTDSERILANYGIKPLVDGFFVANQCPNIDRIYAPTKFGMGAWKKALRKIDGAEVPPHPQSFGALGKQRCTKLPAELLCKEEYIDTGSGEF